MSDGTMDALGDKGCGLSGEYRFFSCLESSP